MVKRLHWFGVNLPKPTTKVVKICRVETTLGYCVYKFMMLVRYDEIGIKLFAYNIGKKVKIKFYKLWNTCLLLYKFNGLIIVIKGKVPYKIKFCAIRIGLID